MTLPSSGQIAVSDVNTEVGLASTYSSSLNFLNGLIVAGQRPGTPNLNSFHGLTYFLNNTQGNCNNGNQGNCNCNCGNIQCNNCTNCNNINCTNCDSQSWLQTNCNCACTYNCNVNATSYNCNCACNCSKIVCAKLYEIGEMPQAIWMADQKYGQLLRKKDKRVYRGYIRWARIVTSWMDAKGPDFMIWVPKEKRAKAQQEAMTNMAVKIGTPWSEHMAYLMGTLKNDNTMGRILMNIGTTISRVVDYFPRVAKHNRKHGLITVYTVWTCLFFSYYTALSCSKILNVKTKLVQGILKNG